MLTLATGYVDYELAWLPPKGPKVPLSTSVVFFALNFAAMSTLVELTEREYAVNDQTLQLRSGIATGSVVAGVVGTKKFIYDLWGDTVNIASRLTSECEPGRIQVDERSHLLLSAQYIFEAPRTLNLKGKGYTTVFELSGRGDPERAKI